MIIVKLQGGLGNQMFQYAIGKKLSLYYKVPLKLDTSFLLNTDETITARFFELDRFKLQPVFAKPEEISLFSNKQSLLHRVKKKVSGAKYISEKSFAFDPSFLEFGKNCYLSGFWQCEKYFSSISQVIKNEFALRQMPGEKNKSLLSLINKTNAVSVHIRRGDYVHNKTANSFHGVCGSEYYENAVKLVEKKVEDPHFFIFSDDINWVQHNFYINHPCTIVDVNDAGNGVLDMNLMKNCKHHIIANSSFSWWGAWLCDNSDKIVTGPAQWFKDTSINTTDILPAGWYKI